MTPEKSDGGHQLLQKPMMNIVDTIMIMPGAAESLEGECT